ncbi:NADH-quinone oxidoreductase subunit J [Robiginitomaculum antarcticum]|uniref:NADH-quinone oxidoreductase subunit J n=1 Tax=Robiginitomaculum antarcticum TaxID=437507 RepID=UPI000685EC71
MVVASRNPVHSVMFLILTFFSAAGLFVLMGAEFLALLLVMVYVGAVAVLFLFVVMMLDVDFSEMKRGFFSYFPMGGVVAVILLMELIVIGGSYFADSEVTPEPRADGLSNIEAFGNVLFTDYAFFFEASGLILLIAMIGAIVLTLRHRTGVRRQDITKQVSRTRKDGVELVEIESGAGTGE